MSEPMARALIFATVFLALMLIEARFPHHETPHRAQRWRGNLGIFLAGLLLVRVLLPLGAVGFAGLVQEWHWGLLPRLALPDGVAWIVVLVLFDLAIYAQHVVFHKVPILWRFHRMHHADIELDMTSGLRFHPGEIALSLLFKLALIALIGPPPFAVFLFEVLLNAGAMATHANWRLPWRAERLLRRLFVTPGMHRVHHSPDRAATDTNYGFNLAIWDRLFGTYREEAPIAQPGSAFGLAEFSSVEEQSVGRLLTQPFRKKKHS